VQKSAERDGLFRYSTTSTFDDSMNKLTKFFRTTWKTLEFVHTGAWLISILIAAFGSTALVEFARWFNYEVTLRSYVLAGLVCFGVVVGLLVAIAIARRNHTESSPIPIGLGGAGGSVKVSGNRAVAIGGRGGKGGLIGSGGAGGGGEVEGDDALSIGGDGGDAGGDDGRGGRGAVSPLQRMGHLPTTLWKYGRGGNGVDAPEYARRLGLLTQFRSEYMIEFPDERKYIDAGVDVVPIEWINARLTEHHESWCVELDRSGYVLPPLK
jgi:hypothetical protein